MQYLQIQSVGGAGTRVNYSIDTSTSPHFKCIASCAGTVSADVPFSWYVNSQVEFQPVNAPGGPGDYTETITVNYDFNDAIPRQYTYQVHGKSVAVPLMTVNPLSYTWPPTVVGISTRSLLWKSGVGPLSGTISMSNLLDLWTFDDANTDWTTHKTLDTSGYSKIGILTGPISAVGSLMRR